jgi:hypothetical protein
MRQEVIEGSHGVIHRSDVDWKEHQPCKIEYIWATHINIHHCADGSGHNRAFLQSILRPICCDSTIYSTRVKLYMSHLTMLNSRLGLNGHFIH